MLNYEQGDGESVLIGTWPPAHVDVSEGVFTLVLHETDDEEEAERWRAELWPAGSQRAREKVP
jgi:hypothetical protein